MVLTIPEEVLERAEELHPYIEEYSETFQLDPNLVRALITQESRFVANAVSPTGAFGYGQFTGIGARQVQNIGKMSDCPDPEGLRDFTKGDADDPDLGVKAICATLWWLFNKKYPNVQDKKIQLEAVLTFYNSGGKAAALVIKHGGHQNAVDHIKALPGRYRSQAVRYAPEVAMWYVAWYEMMKPEPEKVEEKVVGHNPFEKEETQPAFDVRYLTIVAALKLLGDLDPDIDVMLNSREGWTEVTVIVPGEYSNNVRN